MTHSHTTAGVDSSRRMGLSIVLTLAFVAGKATANFYAYNLASISNA
jgi:hypothetical protein